MTLGTATVLRADARNLPLPDASVDLIITSPPYWALRSYTDGGEHYDGQIGSEETPQEYIATLLDCTREWMRVLKPTGSIFVNLGDKYANDAKWGGATGGKHVKALHGRTGIGRARRATGLPPKSLILLPERYRIGCLDELGLTVRAVIEWSKTNGMPEPVTDRVRRSHEDWVHLTKLPRYFAAVDEIREPHTGNSHNGRRDGAAPPGGKQTRQVESGQRGGTLAATNAAMFNPLGKLPGSVWEIPSEPLTVPAHLGVDHFAAFPTEWPKRLILGWSPGAYCTACGEPRRPVTVTELQKYRTAGATGRPKQQLLNGSHSKGRNAAGYPYMQSTSQITGYACACPDTTAPTRPSVVLDPFGGTGSTALAAKALGRHGITVDRSWDYSRIATWRTTDPGQLAKVLGVSKPPVQMDGQFSLFEEDVA